MKVLNVYTQFQGVKLVGNRKALRAVAEAVLAALSKGSADADVLNSKGDPLVLNVEVVDSIADLVRLPIMRKEA